MQQYRDELRGELPEVDAFIGLDELDRVVSRTGLEFQAGLLEARTGRPWSLEETAEYIEQRQSRAADRRSS